MYDASPDPPETFGAAAADRAADLVGALFAALERGGPPYAILRGHERFPRFGHDVDVVIRPADLAAFASYCAAAARSAGWPHATLCRHWAASGVPHQDFEALTFWDIAGRASFKLDLFHGWHVQGLHLLDAEALLASRRLSACGRYRHIDPALEQAWRLLQINDQLHRIGPEHPRMVLFRQRVLAAGPAVAERAAQLLPDHGPRALACLAAEDWPGFSANMTAGRSNIVRRAVGSRPTGAASEIARRALGLARTRLLDPCGFVLRVAGLPDGWGRLRRALGQLHAAGMLFGWRVDDGGLKTFRQRAAVRHFSGIVFRPVAEEADLNLATVAGDEALFERLAGLLIGRHPAVD